MLMLYSLEELHMDDESSRFVSLSLAPSSVLNKPANPRLNKNSIYITVS